MSNKTPSAWGTLPPDHTGSQLDRQSWSYRLNVGKRSNGSQSGRFKINRPEKEYMWDLIKWLASSLHDAR